MKVSLDGFSRHAETLHVETLHVETLEHFRWQDISGILRIQGASYYYVQAGTVGVRYSKMADVRM